MPRKCRVKLSRKESKALAERTGRPPRECKKCPDDASKHFIVRPDSGRTHFLHRCERHARELIRLPDRAMTELSEEEADALTVVSKVLEA